MAKIGSKLQETRLRKGLTLERIADDTNISIRFLSKIENDDFSGFPGEPYVVGFIRNYAEYLGMNPEATIALYRSTTEETPLHYPDPHTASVPTVSDPTRLAEQPEAAEPSAKIPAEESKGIEDAASAAPKPKKPRKAKAAVVINAVENAADNPSAVDHNNSPPTQQASPETPPAEKKLSLPALRAGLLSVPAIIIVGVALLWIVAGGRTQDARPGADRKEPTEYRVEGGPFEMRLYVGDSLLVPIGNEVYKIRLASIGDTVGLETPFGPFELSLGETGPLDPDKNGSPDASLILGDFEKNRSVSGALLRVEFAPPETASSQGAEVIIPETAAVEKPTSARTDSVIIKSTRGPYPFVVQVSFRGNCLFRYEADRKEWVEKYFSKGESVTVNASNALTVWASNAQAVKLSFQASGGKTADLEIGAPGEIAVKRIAWSRAENSWALISTDLD